MMNNLYKRAEQEEPVMSGLLSPSPCVRVLCVVVHSAERGLVLGALLDDLPAGQTPSVAAFCGFVGCRKLSVTSRPSFITNVN